MGIFVWKRTRIDYNEETTFGFWNLVPTHFSCDFVSHQLASKRRCRPQTWPFKLLWFGTWHRRRRWCYGANPSNFQYFLQLVGNFWRIFLRFGTYENGFKKWWSKEAKHSFGINVQKPGIIVSIYKLSFSCKKIIWLTSISLYYLLNKGLRNDSSIFF